MRTAILVLALVASPAFAGVNVTDKELVLSDTIYFDVGKATIKTQSHAILDEVAATLKAQKKIALVEIQVHTDARGSDTFNLEMSQKRAQAVYTYLVRKGVPAKRLRAKGYGETQPLDKAANEAAWAKNRRTVFVIVRVT